MFQARALKSIGSRNIRPGDLADIGIVALEQDRLGEKKAHLSVSTHQRLCLSETQELKAGS
jgi:hypothetical protein